MSLNDVRDTAIKFAVQNAVKHNGRAQSGSVIGKVLAVDPGLKGRVKDIIPTINAAIEEVNSWTFERQTRVLKENWPELLEKKKVVEEKKTLPPLENVDHWATVKTRFAPNPDGALHLGSAEPIIFCDEYAKMYNGHFILRFEDTSAEVKPPIPEMYDAIIKDIEWLGVTIDEKYIQSERLEIYYEYAEQLLREGNAYVCVCEPESFRSLYMASKSCPCRNLPPINNLKRWQKMLDGSYKKGEAVVRIKTDLNYPNPAIRDWPALRISDVEHPLQGNKYRVWPLYNFSCGLDDHLLNVSHIIRGKEHDVNTIRQRWLQKHLGWKYPEIINVGRLGLESGILSKSKMRAGIEDGMYSGWDDPRLGTLMALRRRGLQPEAVREIMIQVGPKPINVTISWDNIATINRRLIEKTANRYFFVKDPIKLIVTNIESSFKANLPLHPDDKKRGTRNYYIDPINETFIFIISREDAERLKQENIIRLMGLFNVEITETAPEHIKAVYHSESYQIGRELNAPFIHWLPEGKGINGKVVMPDASISTGLIEKGCQDLEINDMFQFERFGFCRVDSIKPFMAYYAHN
jgi:glutamyl-tRNA synthetase